MIFTYACIYILFKLQTSTLKHTSSIHCYRSNTDLLPSILSLLPAKGKSIFFHETSCNSARNGKIVITARQACSVESAAKLNPNLEIYLLYTPSGVIKKEATESDRLLQSLQKYENIKIRHVDFGEYVKNSPVEFLVKHASKFSHEVLRFVSLSYQNSNNRDDLIR